MVDKWYINVVSDIKTSMALTEEMGLSFSSAIPLTKFGLGRVCNYIQ